jgi:NTE family protein
LGARRVLAVGTGTVVEALRESTLEEREYPSPAQVGALLMHSVFLDALDADVERLERINRLINAYPPGYVLPDDLRPVRLGVIRPTRDLGALAMGYLPRLPWLMDVVVRGLGARERRGADFMSYLLFEPEYTSLLMELGYEDALEQWERVEQLLVGERGAGRGERDQTR